MIRARSLCFVVVIVVLLAGGTAVQAQSTSKLPRFEPAECPFAELTREATVECGYLVVAEDRTGSKTAELRLSVAIIKHDEAPPDPIVYIAGGPGGYAVDEIDYWLDYANGSGRDFILYDQRGTGYSEPLLTCIDFYYENEMARASRQCRDMLQDEGVTLRTFNSVNNAQDLADLRQALGYDTWNLFGISYGTRLALTEMRNHPEGLRSVVLDSVYPPQVNRLEEGAHTLSMALATLFDDCRAAPSCHETYPELETVFYSLVARRNENPVHVSVLDSFSGEPVGFDLDGDTILSTVVSSLNVPVLVPYVPWALYELKEGRPLALSLLAMWLFPTWGEVEDWVYFSVECHEEVPFNDTAVIATELEQYPDFTSYYDLETLLHTCAVWSGVIASADKVENQPVTSDIPALLLAGAMDSTTPPAWSEQTAVSLSHSYRYEFPGLGHAVTTWHDCPWQIALAFWDNPNQPPNSDCLADMTTPTNYVTDFYATDSLYNFGLNALAPQSPLRFKVPALLYIVVFASAISLLPFSLRKRLGTLTDVELWLEPNKKRWPANLALGCLVATALFNLLYLIGLLWLYDNTAVLLGVLPTRAWYFDLVVIPGIMRYVILATAIWLWRNEPWYGRHHAAYYIITLFIFIYPIALNTWSS